MRWTALAMTGLAALSASAGVRGVRIDRSADRVRTPLRLDLERLGTLCPRAAHEIRSSNWTLGCETLDRDFANFEDSGDKIEIYHNCGRMVTSTKNAILPQL